MSLLELRIADWITAFAGSMTFVYLHIALFTVWMLFIESKPWPTLTLIVSLEAIFLSTFVMIGQNRQAAFQQAKADHDFTEQELELKTNTQLTREIHQLTTELHQDCCPGPPGSSLDAQRGLALIGMERHLGGVEMAFTSRTCWWRGMSERTRNRRCRGLTGGRKAGVSRRPAW